MFGIKICPACGMPRRKFVGSWCSGCARRAYLTSLLVRGVTTGDLSEYLHEVFPREFVPSEVPDSLEAWMRKK